MSKVTKYALLISGLNIVAFIICLILANNSNDLGAGLAYLLFIPGMLFLFQLIAGIVLVAGTRHKEIGKAMLITIGVTFLVGFSVCGILAGF
ncbi:MAG TPA: hypothetical protein VGD17_01740 [Chitinophagaceae bacterium]